MAFRLAAGATRLDRLRHEARSFVGNLDRSMLVITALLVAYGMVVVYSASLTTDEASAPRQALGVLIGLALGAATYRFDYRQFTGAIGFLFFFDCLLMVAPLIPGLSYEANGITGWVRVPIVGLTFQTSELAKPVTILLVAALAARYNGRIDRLSDYLKLLGVLAVPFALIMLQPDLGTGLVVLVSGAAIILVAGPRRQWVVATLVILVGAVTVVLLTDSIIDAAVGDDLSLIKDYQMNRLLVFLDPEHDATGSGYNLQQALIAVGSGGFFGKGLGNATQAGGGFLPEAHTDFVFALLAEEFGFLGSAVLLLLYVLLIFSSLRIAYRCDALYGKLVIVGIAAMWTFQIFENVGMCISLMPITGIPLPFISFGSSSMIAQLMTVGLVLSIDAHAGRSV